MTNILTTPLSPEDLKTALGKVLSFSVMYDSEGELIILDDHGSEFYSFDVNLKYDLSTLNGIIDYYGDLRYREGKKQAQTDIKIAIGFYG